MKDKRMNMRKLLSAHFSYIVGTEFNNTVVDELFKHSGTKHKVSSSYHPKTNGDQP